MSKWNHTDSELPIVGKTIEIEVTYHTVNPPIKRIETAIYTGYRDGMPSVLTDGTIFGGASFLWRYPKQKQPKPSKWHRVEDELPKHTHNVLVKFASSDDDFDITFYNDMGHWNTLVKSTVTHWRELPKPPKKGKSK